MDPNTLIDLLYLKLTLEHQHSVKVTSDSFDKTRESLKRIRTKSSSSVASWIAQSLLHPNNKTEKELARLAIFDPLCFEDKTKLLSQFDSKHHNIVEDFVGKLIPRKQKLIKRYRSNLRSRVRYD